MARRTFSSRLSKPISTPAQPLALSVARKLLVVRRIDAHLRDPADAERGQRLGQLARKGQIGGEIVVDEEEQALLGFQRGDLGDDRVDRAMPGGALEERLHRAELAGKAAAAAGLDQPELEIAAAAEQRAVVAHQGEVGLAVGAVDRLQPLALARPRSPAARCPRPRPPPPPRRSPSPRRSSRWRGSRPSPPGRRGGDIRWRSGRRAWPYRSRPGWRRDRPAGRTGSAPCGRRET